MRKIINSYLLKLIVSEMKPDLIIINQLLPCIESRMKYHTRDRMNGEQSERKK